MKSNPFLLDPSFLGRKRLKPLKERQGILPRLCSGSEWGRVEDLWEKERVSYWAQDQVIKAEWSFTTEAGAGMQGVLKS